MDNRRGLPGAGIRVAIASGYTKHNFGSMLQAYATQTYLDSLGFDVRTIDMSGLKHAISQGRLEFFASRLVDFDYVKEKGPFALHRVQQKLYPKFRQNMRRRNSAFNTFANSQFHTTRRTFSFEELRELSTEYDAIVVGSDQLWTPANIAGRYFTLEWADEAARKLSYATSIGLSKLENRELERLRSFLGDFYAVSVREDTGAKLVEMATGNRPSVVCDPTMLLESEKWASVANEAFEEIPTQPYVLCYFLGNNRWQREAVTKFARAEGLKIVALAHNDVYVTADNDYADTYAWGAGPAEWLALVMNATLVCTDSFHGTVFSNIFQVPFITFRRHAPASVQSTNTRLDNLLNTLELSGRICESPGSFAQLAITDIDFTVPQKRLLEFRRLSSDWLTHALTFNNLEIPNHIRVSHPEDCCGCAACANTCPANCITMKYDEEGCEYPYVNENDCVSCGKCISACPVINVQPDTATPQRAFVVQNQNDAILRQSTSGGAFSALATTTIEMGGVVFGAGYDRANQSDYDADLNVRCIPTEHVENLRFFRNSKYIQSEIGDAYRQVKSYLNEGRLVLFSGTPCQCEGLFHFFGGSRPRGLAMVDFVCRGVPCRAVFKTYLNWLKDTTNEDVQTVLFRDKGRWGYEYSNLRAFNTNEPFIAPGSSVQKPAQYSAGVESDPYLRAFFNDLSDRPCCYRCMFKKRHRVTDVTLWDCFDAWRYGNSFDDNRGATRMLVHTKLGQDMLDASLNMLRCVEIDAEQATRLSYELTHSVNINPKRTAMFDDLSSLQHEEFFVKWFPDSRSIKFRRFIRETLEKAGVYSSAKRILWTFREGS